MSDTGEVKTLDYQLLGLKLYVWACAMNFTHPHFDHLTSSGLWHHMWGMGGRRVVVAGILYPVCPFSSARQSYRSGCTFSFKNSYSYCSRIPICPSHQFSLIASGGYMLQGLSSVVLDKRQTVLSQMGLLFFVHPTPLIYLLLLVVDAKQRCGQHQEITSQ